MIPERFLPDGIKTEDTKGLLRRDFVNFFRRYGFLPSPDFIKHFKHCVTPEVKNELRHGGSLRIVKGKIKHFDVWADIDVRQWRSSVELYD